MMSAKRSIVAVALCGLIVVSSCLCVFSEEIKTYGEWCNKLNELHRELEEIQETRESAFWYVNEPMFIGLGISAVVLMVLLGLENLPGAEFAGVAISLPFSIGWMLSIARREAGKEKVRLVQVEINLLVTAGANRMWFYPCSPSE